MSHILLNDEQSLHAAFMWICIQIPLPTARMQ